MVVAALSTLFCGRVNGTEPHSSSPSDHNTHAHARVAMQEAEWPHSKEDRKVSKANRREVFRATGYFDPTDSQTIYKCKHPTEKSNSTFAWKNVFLRKPHLASLGFLNSIFYKAPLSAIQFGGVPFLFCWSYFVEINYFLCIFLNDDLIHLMVFCPHHDALAEHSFCYYREFLWHYF